MSKITEYQEKKVEFEALKQVGKLTLVQIEYVEGGIQNMFSVPGAPPLAVKAILSSVNRQGDKYLGDIFTECETDLKAAELEAIAEAEQFVLYIQHPELVKQQEVTEVVEEVIAEEVMVDNLVESESPVEEPVATDPIVE